MAASSRKDRPSWGGTAPPPPSYKQSKYLDALVRKLGYESGKAYAREVYGVDQYGVVKDWTRAGVHKLIEQVRERLATRERIEQRRIRENPFTRGPEKDKRDPRH